MWRRKEGYEGGKIRRKKVRGPKGGGKVKGRGNEGRKRKMKIERDWRSTKEEREEEMGKSREVRKGRICRRKGKKKEGKSRELRKGRIRRRKEKKKGGKVGR
jgi:hypothetical protein